MKIEFFFLFQPFRRLLNTNKQTDRHANYICRLYGNVQFNIVLLNMKYIVGCTVRNCRDGDWWLFNVETDTRSTIEALCCIQVQIQDLPLKLCGCIQVHIQDLPLKLYAVSRYRYKIYH